MTRSKQVWFSILLGGAILILALLAAGLGQLELRSGSRVIPEAAEERNGNPPVIDLTELFGEVDARSILIGFALMAAMLLFAILSRDVRRRLWAMLLRAGVILLALYLLGPQLEEIFLESQAVEGPSQPGPTGEAVETLPFVAQAPDWAAFLTSIAVVLALLAAAWLVWRRLHRPAPALQAYARRAQAALEGLHAGGDFRDIILRCYHEMEQVASHEVGVSRQDWMTPREFERRLATAGLPGEPVEQLTRLFEAVRYGEQPPGEIEERQAVTCLEAIVQAAGRPA